jgi:hypothetical protein
MISRYRSFIYLILACLCGRAAQVAAQNPASPVPIPDTTADKRLFSCPGSFPTDLTIVNCSYTPAQRAKDFVTGSLTDLSLFEAITTGAFAAAIRSPGEWSGTWENYGRRVGVRYNQAVAKGAAEFVLGSIDREDPRHVSYRNDPGERPGSKAGAWKRIGHAFYDSISDRISKDDAKGHRFPALTRYVGAYASGYGGYAWNPGPENTFKNASLRAAQSLGTDVAISFYTEFSPGLSKLLGTMVKRGRAPKH